VKNTSMYGQDGVKIQSHVFFLPSAVDHLLTIVAASLIK